MSRRLLFLVNEDSFFVSHRFELGLAARDAGFEVIVAAGEGGGRQAIEAAGLRFVPVVFDRGGRSATRDARTVSAITALYARERPSLVHHVTIKPVLYGSLAARALGIPAVVNAVSGLGFVFLDPSRRGRILRLAVERAYRLALSHPQSVTVFQNDDDRSHFVERGMITPARARIVRGSGVDPARFPERPLPAGDEPIVLLPARLLWDKGVGEFADAARRLRAAGVRARFVLVGAADGTNPARVPRASLERWVDEGFIEWWGHRRDMSDVYAQAQLVVLPSYREGFPLALLEAAATGRACVTTDVPGSRDAVDAQTGWLVQARDAAALAATIQGALADRAELERRGKAAAERVRAGFTKQLVVNAHLQLYRELLGTTWGTP